MERQIKFRGFGSGKWRYGYYVHFDEKPLSVIYNPKFRDFIISQGKYGEHAIPVDPETVGQYTGLHDKNGKEIYEGDLLGTKESNHYLEVRYLDGGFRLCGTDDDTGCGSVPIHYLINNINLVIEVIGNVHEK